MATAQTESSHLGKTIRFEGEIAGGEDIFVDGTLEGSINLPGHLVTVGPNGQVNANVQARELVIHGKLKGNAQAQDRIEVSRTGSVQGDLAMARISIQDGAFMQGRVDIRANAPAAATPRAAAAPAATSPAASSATPGVLPGLTPPGERKF